MSKDKVGKWFFAPFDAITDGAGLIKSGEKIELLTCSTLEKLIAAVDKSGSDWRIWGRITKFQDRNYIFIAYFLPITKPKTPAASQQIIDPNDPSIIPEDALELLRPKRVINLAKLTKGIESEADGIFTDRTGFVSRTVKDGYIFELDAVGRNIDLAGFELLKSEVLEKIITKQAKSPYELRYKAAGILTKYKGTYYLLLQRAVRTHSHQNFGNF